LLGIFFELQLEFAGQFDATGFTRIRPTKQTKQLEWL